MAKLTGIAIYKLLPKTNCGDCNVPTCMAFAMQVAAKKVALEACPHVSQEAVKELAEAAAPPMRTITVGTGADAIQIGGETVLFRHEEKFHHPTALAVRIADSSDVAAEAGKVAGLKFIRSGKEVHVELIAVEQTGGTGPFVEAVKTVQAKVSLPLVLMGKDAASLAEAVKVCASSKPLVYAADKQNHQELAGICKQYQVPLAVKGTTLEEISDLVPELRKAGVEDLVLAPSAPSSSDAFTKLTQLRRLALEKAFRPLGYPVMTFTDTADPMQEALTAILHLCKYSSLVVMKGTEHWQILPVLTARYNIFTDPQVPNAVEAKLYKVGEPSPNSPVLVTTNFALTYFTVEGEVDNSKIPAYIATVETGGLGVLNSYADDKLTGETIAKAVKNCGVMQLVKHNKLIIPGLVAVLRGELEDESGCEILVGPEEAAAIPAYLKNEWK